MSDLTDGWYLSVEATRFLVQLLGGENTTGGLTVRFSVDDDPFLDGRIRTVTVPTDRIDEFVSILERPGRWRRRPGRHAAAMARRIREARGAA